MHHGVGKVILTDTPMIGIVITNIEKIINLFQKLITIIIVTMEIDVSVKWMFLKQKEMMAKVTE